jgi:hypothetical protein
MLPKRFSSLPFSLFCQATKKSLGRIETVLIRSGCLQFAISIVALTLLKAMQNEISMEPIS